MRHLTTAELNAGLDLVRLAPADNGVVELIVRRPDHEEREVIDAGHLTLEDGLVGDNWLPRGSRHTPDGSAELARQLTIMNARAIALFAQERDRWPLAGDQLYVDFDISEDNLPAGSRLRLGDAVVEVSVEPHTGCAKFLDRFGQDAARFVHTPEGRRLRLRGLNARIVEPGTVRTGDQVGKVHTPDVALA